MTSAASAMDAWVPLLVTKTLGSYKLLQCIGRGGFALVFEAEHVDTGARFAVKVLSPTPDVQSAIEFRNEGVLLRHLNSCDGVINFVDEGTEKIEIPAGPGLVVPLEFPYIVLSLASGSVDEIIMNPAARNKLGWIERLRFFRDSAKAIRQMHNQGVAHRDLKCSNCLMMVRGNTTFVRLGDLGRAKDLGSGPTLPIDFYVAGRGDLRYAPPEHLYLQGGVSAQEFMSADYYGLGSLLVEIITGQGLTALALGSFGPILAQSQVDHAAGRQRDIGTLSSRYRSTILSVVSVVPSSIKDDAETVLTHLTRPVPGERLARAPYSRDRLSREPLDWVIRRIDIMIRRLEIEARQARRVNQKVRIPA